MRKSGQEKRFFRRIGKTFSCNCVRANSGDTILILREPRQTFRTLIVITKESELPTITKLLGMLRKLLERLRRANLDMAWQQRPQSKVTN